MRHSAAQPGGSTRPSPPGDSPVPPRWIGLRPSVSESGHSPAPSDSTAPAPLWSGGFFCCNHSAMHVHGFFSWATTTTLTLPAALWPEPGPLPPQQERTALHSQTTRRLTPSSNWHTNRSSENSSKPLPLLRSGVGAFPLYLLSHACTWLSL